MFLVFLSFEGGSWGYTQYAQNFLLSLCSGIPVGSAQGTEALSSIKTGSVACEGSSGTLHAEPSVPAPPLPSWPHRSCEIGTLPDLCRSETRSVTVGALLAQTGRPCPGGLGTLQGQERKLFPRGNPHLCPWRPAPHQPLQRGRSPVSWRPCSMLQARAVQSPAILPSTRPAPACRAASSSPGGHATLVLACGFTVSSADQERGARLAYTHVRACSRQTGGNGDVITAGS